MEEDIRRLQIASNEDINVEKSKSYLDVRNIGNMVQIRGKSYKNNS